MWCLRVRLGSPRRPSKVKVTCVNGWFIPESHHEAAKRELQEILPLSMRKATRSYRGLTTTG